jgi:pyruvate dehydrogenase E2 component (dihydrolipoamide acetyltransferase)
MPDPIVMPSFGMYTSEGTLVNWIHSSGARVKQGEVILEIETEKAVNPVISPSDGILFQVAEIGALIKEEGLLGYVLAEGEVAPAVPGTPPKAFPSEGTERSSAASDESGRAVQDRVKASPAARKLALERGIDLAALVGTGPGNRIVEADVRTAIEQKGQRSDFSGTRAPESHLGKPAGDRGQVMPLSVMRRTIGERLRRSINSAVSLTITREIESGGLVIARKVLSDKLRVSVPYDALFMKLLAAALRECPELNVIIEGNDLRKFDAVSVCFAVSMPDGLVAPVVRDVDSMPLSRLVDQMARLTEQARSNSLHSEDLSGGVSTITNLGAFGVDAFTPILNPPQSSILGVGRIAERPIARNGVITAAPTCWLSLTFDHRVTDGVPAARLLEFIGKSMTDQNYLCNLD